jgi:uncharacterized protein YndB with AHSA1/START domain
MARPATDRARARVTTLALLGALSLGACDSGSAAGSNSAPSGSDGSLPQGSKPVKLDPADFTVDITNQYWPMKPGQRWVYRETDAEGHVQRGETTVLDRTEKIAGIEARVVHDVLTDQDGSLVEDTTDWYAQDSQGNLWYLGEKTAEYENGQVSSTEGTWRTGEDDAQAGIILPAEPRPGLKYRQEYRADQAEDKAIVLSTSEQAQTPTGTYKNALLTRDTTPLEPDLVELKWYAPGVGLVLTVTSSGGADREELVEAPSG